MLEEGLIVFLLLFSLELAFAMVTGISYHHDDEQWLHRWAIEVIQGERSGWDYSFFLAGLYGLFGTNLMVGKVLNGLTTALLPFLVFRIARTIFPEGRVPRTSFYWCCLSIPLLLYGAFSLKESLTAFFLTAAIGGLALAKRHALTGCGVAIGLTFILTALRPVYAGILVPAIVVYLLSPDSCGNRSDARWLMLTTIFASSFFLANSILSGMDSRFSTNYLEQLQQRQTFAGQIFTSTDTLNPSNILIASIAGIYSPPPIRLLLGIGNVLESITMLTWYVIVPFFVLGTLNASPSPIKNAIASTVLIGSLVASISLVFAGVSDRHRIPLLPLMCIFAGNGHNTMTQRRWFYVWWASIFVFNFLYWYMRASFA